MEKKTVCIIGGGAAGLVSAIFAARNHVSVILLEQNEKPGRKLLATGNGRCNLTNTYQHPSCYHGRHPEFAWEVIQQFPMQQTVAFFSKLGIYTRNRDGYLYPASLQGTGNRYLCMPRAGAGQMAGQDRVLAVSRRQRDHRLRFTGI